jgi:hypothetical protein
VQNVGPIVAPASTVKYYLVSLADQSLIDLKGTQAVPALTPGQTFTENQDVKVRPTTPPGFYALRACADSAKVVPEPDDEDNCLTSAGVVEVHALPDLVINRVTVEDSPVVVARGASFNVTSVVKNQGLGDAGASTTKFYLILTPGAAQKKGLTGTQSVPPVPLQRKFNSTVSVQVEENTIPGTYYVLGCADEVVKSVVENDDNNNCTTSLETVVVQ